MQMEATVRQDFALETFAFEHLSKDAQPSRQLYVSLGSVFNFIFSLNPMQHKGLKLSYVLQPWYFKMLTEPCNLVRVRKR